VTATSTNEPEVTSLPRVFLVETRPALQDIDGPGTAPCDFDRGYRGTIGKTPVSLVLQASEGKITGLAHYDREGPSLTLYGFHGGASDFTIDEHAGGSFQGTCDQGVLRGTFTLGKRRDVFELQPRPKDWPGIYRVTRRTQVEPNHPICRTKAAFAEAIETSEEGEDYPRIVCLPRNPAKRRALLAEAPHLLCHAEDVGYRVFGLPSTDQEKRSNDILSATGYESAVKDIQRCTGTRSSFQSMSLVAARRDFLSVTGFTSQDFGGVHPMNSGTGGMLVDLARGTLVTLPDIVDVPRFRDVVSACLPVYALAYQAKDAFELPKRLEPTTCESDGASMGRYLWACDKDDREDPAWAIVREGIVIGSWANPHVSAALDGQGPIIPWAVLLREGLLRADSSAKFLWAGVAPAAADALPCWSAYEGDVIRSWRAKS
jgi:hypothetical protein